MPDALDGLLCRRSHRWPLKIVTFQGAVGFHGAKFVERLNDVNDISRLFQAFLAPALFVSATALLILSINVRLMGMVSRLRQYVHAKHDASKNGRTAEADAYTAQIESIEQRAELIRRCFLLALISLAGTIASCLLLGLASTGRRRR